MWDGEMVELGQRALAACEDKEVRSAVMAASLRAREQTCVTSGVRWTLVVSNIRLC